MRMSARFGLTSILALVSALAFPSGAQAAGALTPVGCVDDNDAFHQFGCAHVNGLNEPSSVAVSPDGASVYVTSDDDDALVRFNRSSTGALTPAGCVDDNDTGDDVCAQSVNGLTTARSVAVSPDGASVYVASFFDGAVVRFNRSPSGTLTPAGCVDDNDNGPDVCAQSVNGLDGANSVAVSPDGASVYVASLNDSAVVRFNRSSTGALTLAGCVDDNDTGYDVCAQSVNGLYQPTSVAVSPDGASVYVASFFDGAVVRFNRSSTGALTPAGCVDDNDTGDDACAQSVNGLWGPRSVTVSPDGASVYVTSQDDHALVRFNRSSTGALTPAGCVDDIDTGSDVCAQSVNALGGPFSVAVSPDGKSVYVALFFDQAVVRFDRGSTGTLSPAGCVDDTESGSGTCDQSHSAIGGARSVAVSPDGKSVYVASAVSDALVSFERSN